MCAYPSGQGSRLQSVEFIGSTPIAQSIPHGDHGVVGSTTDCDPVGGGSNPPDHPKPTSVAQWRERSSDTRVVAGSTPARGTSSTQPVVVQSGPEPLSARE